VTKTKSRLVLEILKLGYNVLLSDVDVYWFKNPIPLLQIFGPAVLAAQSDEYNVTGNLIPRASIFSFTPLQSSDFCEPTTICRQLQNDLTLVYNIIHIRGPPIYLS